MIEEANNFGFLCSAANFCGENGNFLPDARSICQKQIKIETCVQHVCFSQKTRVWVNKVKQVMSWRMRRWGLEKVSRAWAMPGQRAARLIPGRAIWRIVPDLIPVIILVPIPGPILRLVLCPFLL